MWRSIVLWFLSILLWFSPNSKSLRFEYDKAYYDQQTIADTVFPIIKAQNASLLEAKLCKNIKDSILDYQSKIDEIFSLTDGITSYKLSGGGAEYDGSRGGKSISQKTCDLRYTINGTNYRLFILWEVNNFSPAEKGIRQISVGYVGVRDPLVSMDATEGIRNWHD